MPKSASILNPSFLDFLLLVLLIAKLLTFVSSKIHSHSFYAKIRLKKNIYFLFYRDFFSVQLSLSIPLHLAQSFSRSIIYSFPKIDKDQFFLRYNHVSLRNKALFRTNKSNMVLFVCNLRFGPRRSHPLSFLSTNFFNRNCCKSSTRH